MQYNLPLKNSLLTVTKYAVNLFEKNRVTHDPGNIDIKQIYTFKHFN